jgi:hypothetical protein
MNCAQPMKVASTAAYRCTACGLFEIGTTGQQQQQPQPKDDTKK